MGWRAKRSTGRQKRPIRRGDGAAWSPDVVAR